EGATHVGSHVCGLCHFQRGLDHAGSAHANSLPSDVTGALRERFIAGDVVALAHGSATLGMDGDTPTVTVSAGLDARTFGVAGLIGSPQRGQVPFTEIEGQ